MNTPKKLPLVQEMERAFQYLNTLHFDDKLKIPTHVIQPERKHAFRFVPESYHIIIGGGFLDLNIAEDVLAAYVHEMVHVHNYMNHISDCSSQYHKIGYMESAKEIGFYVARHKTQGWCLTTLYPPDCEHHVPDEDKNKFLKNTIRDFEFPQDILDAAREHIEISVKTPRKVCFLKYVCECPPPHNSIRSGRRPDGLHPINIRCEDCGSLFIEEAV